MSDFVATDVKNTAEACGKRLKILRKMLDLSRRAFTEKYQISASTIQAWEEGKAGGLTKKGADRIVTALREEGLFCSTEWLLSGLGKPPYLADRIFLRTAEATRAYGRVALRESPDAIMKELEMFRQGNGDVNDMVVEDDGMCPFYQIGDMIAGKRYYDKQMAEFIGKDCILETETGEITFRRLRRGNEVNCYHLQAVNLDTTVNEPMRYNVVLISIAPVIWHRRPK